MVYSAKPSGVWFGASEASGIPRPAGRFRSKHPPQNEMIVDMLVFGSIYNACRHSGRCGKKKDRTNERLSVYAIEVL